MENKEVPKPLVAETEIRVTADNLEAPRNNVEYVKNEVQQAIEDLTPKEKEILHESMKGDTPLPFEPKEVGTDQAAYLQNEMAKEVSGITVGDKIRSIVQKSLRKILLTTMFVGIFSNKTGDTKIPENISSEEKTRTTIDVQKLPAAQDSLDVLKTIDMSTLNSLSKNAQRVYMYAASHINESYIIADKPSATLYVIGADKKIKGSFPFLRGQMAGESENLSDPDSDVAYHATTPAGRYNIKGSTYFSKHDIENYKGKNYSFFECADGSSLMIHITYQGELKKRTQALNTETPSDNFMSWGCINMDEENWDKYFAPNFESNMNLFILPDDDRSLSLNPETSKLESHRAFEDPGTQYAQSIEKSSSRASKTKKDSRQKVDKKVKTTQIASAEKTKKGSTTKTNRT